MIGSLGSQSMMKKKTRQFKRETAVRGRQRTGRERRSSIGVMVVQILSSEYLLNSVLRRDFFSLAPFLLFSVGPGEWLKTVNSSP